MPKRMRALTIFGRDLDSLLKQAGISSLREYADTCNVNYKYLSQLRTIPERRPGKLYVDLLKPFTLLKILDISNSHRFSLRHRGKHLSFAECNELFPELSEQEILESVKQAGEVIDNVIAYDEPGKGEISSPDTGLVSSRRELLYRKVFVGRQTELSLLMDTFDAAVAGQGSLIMIAGEPGIGKTAVCEQLSRFVTLRDGTTIWGQCYVEGLSLPYLPFVEVMRSYTHDRETDDLKKELGAGASDIARIVPEIREKLNIEPREAQDPEEDRYRLMQSVSSFLANAASSKPTLIILEDLHDADKGTLDMLSYVSRNLTGTRLLIIGTYRDIEVDRSHPLSSTLAELRRIASFDRLLLHGLTIDEVKLMLARITQEDISASVAENLHRQTEGNPLFVQEAVRYLIEEGLLLQNEGHWCLAEDTTLEMSIPEGLREVIGKRLTLLSSECNQLLSIAAVIGKEFRLELLQNIAGISEDEFINSLEEARKAAVVEERPGLGATVSYRFTHAFFRQTLYEEMIAPRRIRLHQQIANSLEEIYANQLLEHATELAEHFSHSSDTADLEKAVKYGEMAATRASEVHAYGEAARLLDQAVNVQRVLNPDDKEKMCDLHLGLCDVLQIVPDLRRLLEVDAPAAFALADSLGDSSRAVHACSVVFLTMILETSITEAASTPEWAEWAARADYHAVPDTEERAWADFALGCIECTKNDFMTGLDFLYKAYEQGKGIKDSGIIVCSGTTILLFTNKIPYTAQRLKLADEMWVLSRSGLQNNEAWFHPWIGDVFLAVGQRYKAEEVFSELRNLAMKRPSDVQLGLVSAAMDTVLATIDGRLDSAKELARKINENNITVGVGSTLFWTRISSVRSYIYSGIPVEASFENILEEDGRPSINLALIHAYNGQKKELLGFFEPGLTSQQAIQYPNWFLIFVLEAALLLEDRQLVSEILPIFSDSGIHTTGMWHSTCVDRHLGNGAALLGRYNEAREHYKEAIRTCTEMRFRPELALSRFQLAELLLDHYQEEKAEALEHLDFAIKEFREMKMKPSLEKALRRKDILKA